MTKLAAKLQMLRNEKREKGVTAIEYGLIAALVAVGIILAATALGTGLSTLFNNIANKVSGVVVP